MFTSIAAAIFVVMAMALARAFIGPTLYDRILAANMFGTKTVLLIAVLGFLNGRPEFMDVAMTYALINFISIVGLLRFSEYKRSSSKTGGDAE